MVSSDVKMPAFAVAMVLAAGFMVQQVSAHGLVFSPPARTWFCGYTTKPDEVLNDGKTPAYPQCKETFGSPLILNQNSGNQQGYNFMSFATHDLGYQGTGPKKFVCSMESDFSAFSKNITYQDLSINWPTTNINSGRYDFVWDTRWGPHYSDTNEFVYWITKPDFVYTVGKDLTWDDFDTTPFCKLAYAYGTPNANVKIDSSLTVFTTSCTIPARTGRHIIKAEWGRTPPTYERFHSCIDVVIGGGGSSGGSTTKTTTTTTVSRTTTSSAAPTSASRTTTAVPTSASRTTTTTRTTATTAVPTTTGCAALYQQCGGQGWTGPTCCASGKCNVLNNYYSQCVA
ncbi:chitin binding domain-containing protein [Cladochytrium replicatum]|nr:chitin binding domain-containing protein [Cladochytrium replicatum]